MNLLTWTYELIDELIELVDKHAPCVTVKREYHPITFNSASRDRKTRCLECTRLRSDRDAWVSQLRSSQVFYKDVQNLYWQTLVLSSIMGNKRSRLFNDNLSADIFLDCFNKVQGVRSATARSPLPDFKLFQGGGLENFITPNQSDVIKLISTSANKTCSFNPAPTSGGWPWKFHNYPTNPMS